MTKSSRSLFVGMVIGALVVAGVVVAAGGSLLALLPLAIVVLFFPVFFADRRK